MLEQQSDALGVAVPGSHEQRSVSGLGSALLVHLDRRVAQQQRTEPRLASGGGKQQRVLALAAGPVDIDARVRHQQLNDGRICVHLVVLRRAVHGHHERSVSACVWLVHVESALLEEVANDLEPVVGDGAYERGRASADFIRKVEHGGAGVLREAREAVGVDACQQRVQRGHEAAAADPDELAAVARHVLWLELGLCGGCSCSC